MPIQARCPQCQKSYKLSDDRRGKQVRCQACSHLFRVGEPAAKTPADSHPPATRTMATAPKPKAKPTPAPEPAVTAGPGKSRLLVIALIAGAVLILCGGAGAAVIGGLWYFLNRPASGPIAAAPTPTGQPGDGPLKTDNTNPPTKTPNGDAPSSPTPPDKTSNPSSASTITQANFDKVDKGMTLDAVTALLGPETDIGRKPPEHDYVNGGTKIVVIMMRGQVTGKSNNQGWPVVYPSDVAASPPPTTDKLPPPDKPPPVPKVQITQELFDKIDKGMTMDQLVALAGKPSGNDDLRRLNDPSVDTRVSWENFVADVGITVDMVQGKVTSKKGYSHGKFWPVVYPSGADASPAKPAGSLTRASFDKIDKGMSMDDVVALLGPPTFSVKLDPVKFQGVDAELTFTNIGVNAAATIGMFQGKVLKKENAQNWPVVYPTEHSKNP
jgi:predicted Zn finger-like uncharacterized protein